MRKAVNYLWICCMVVVITAGCSKIYMIEPDMEDVSTNEGQVDGNEESPEDQEPITSSEDEENTPEEDSDAQEEIPEDTSEEPEDVKDTDEEVGDDTPSEPSELDARFVDQFSTEDNYDVDIDLDALDSTSVDWSFKRNTDHTPVTGYYTIDLDLFGAYFINHNAAEEKVVYLTFDEGYENGFTPEILDTLAANNVKATFFLTKPYIDSNPELVKRMIEEGHQAGNHSKTHGDFGSMSDDTIYEELTQTADAFEEVTGQKMDPFFRPPSGKYSERALYVIRKLGFRSIFWSMAIPDDWNVEAQPGKEYVYNHVMTNYHNGCIILLHAVSESDTQALDDILKDLKAEGYRFGSLYELE